MECFFGVLGVVQSGKKPLPTLGEFFSGPSELRASVRSGMMEG